MARVNQKAASNKSVGSTTHLTEANPRSARMRTPSSSLALSEEKRDKQRLTSSFTSLGKLLQLQPGA